MLPSNNPALSHGPAAPGEVLITPDRAVIWRLHLDAVAQTDWPLLCRLLSDEERARSERFHFDHDRRVYIAAHAACRAMLSYYAGRPPLSWTFQVEDYGKPEVVPTDGLPRLRANISHTRGLAAVALTVDHDIGVDVEWLARTPDIDGLAARMFASQECVALNATPAAQKHEMFLAFWTLKEAYIKAIGKGLSQPLDAFAFDLETLKVRFDDHLADDPACWRFERFRLGPDHVMALGLRRPNPAQATIEDAPAPLDYLRGLA